MENILRFYSITIRERIDADEALRIGLVNRLVPADEVLREARLYEAQISESNLETLMAVKKICIRATDMEEFTGILQASLGNR